MSYLSEKYKALHSIPITWKGNFTYRKIDGTNGSEHYIRDWITGSTNYSGVTTVAQLPVGKILKEIGLLEKMPTAIAKYASYIKIAGIPIQQTANMTFNSIDSAYYNSKTRTHNTKNWLDTKVHDQYEIKYGNFEKDAVAYKVWGNINLAVLQSLSTHNGKYVDLYQPLYGNGEIRLNIKIKIRLSESVKGCWESPAQVWKFNGKL